MGLFLTIVELTDAFGLTFITCELGQRITNAFEESSDILNQFHWYLFTPEIQQMLPMIMQFAQKPTVFYCFGSKASVRETFKSVRIKHV